MADPVDIGHWLQALIDGRDLDWPDVQERLADRPQLIAQLRRTERLVRGFAQVHDASAAGPAWTVAFRWGHLQVGAALGRGSHGEVFRAFDSVLEREVALKLRQRDSLSVGNFISEARRLARVRHPNVLPVHGAAVHDGRAGLWADLIEGESIAAWVERHGPVPVGTALALVRDLADALRAVHAAGLVHGDVKPDNVMRESASGRLVLMDFGSAADRGHAARHGLLGSPTSMAVEQLTGQPVGPAADIYGLGVVLYHLVDGRYPVTSTTVQEIAREHERGDVQARIQGRRAVAHGVRRLLVRMLAPEERRRPDPAGVIDEIDRLVQAPERRRRVLAVSAALVGLATALAASVWALWRVGNERDAAIAAGAREASVALFMRDMLRAPDPAVHGVDVRVVDVLSAAVPDARIRFADQPALLVHALGTIGHSLRVLRYDQPALAVLEEALALHRAHVEAGTADEPGDGCELERQVLQVRIRLEADTDFIAPLRQLLERCQQALGPAHRNSLAVLLDLAGYLVDSDNGDAALPLAERALQLLSGSTDDRAVKAAAAHNLIGMVHARASRHADAAERFGAALDGLRQADDLMHSQAFAARQGLALAAHARGDLDAAETVLREDVEVIERRFGERHEFLSAGLTNLGGILQEQGRLEEALVYLDRAVELDRRHGSAGTMAGVAARINRANVLADLGRVERAGTERRAVFERARELGGADHPNALIAAINLAEQYLDEGDPVAARDLAGETLQRCRQRFGAGHPFTLAAELVQSRARFARVPDSANAEAMAAVCAQVGAAQGEHGDGHLDCLVHLAKARLDLGERDAALELLRQLRSQVADTQPGSARRRARIDALAACSVRVGARVVAGRPIPPCPDDRLDPGRR